MIVKKRRCIFVIGLSGAGKTTVLSLLNDMNYHTVDNLPISMIESYLQHLPLDDKPVALGFSVRTVDFCSKTILETFSRLKIDFDTHLLFLKANSYTLQKRYSLTGMTHPLCTDGRLEKAITLEYNLYEDLIEMASMVLDTDDLSPRDLRHYLMNTYDEKHCNHTVFIIKSFGFKYGVPQDVETIFDARILKNPHWHKDLASLTGIDKPVQDFLKSDETTQIFLNKVTDYITQAIIPFVSKNKLFYHIAIGCTGGRHRSVYSAEKIYQFLKNNNIYCRLEHKVLE